MENVTAAVRDRRGPGLLWCAAMVMAILCGASPARSQQASYTIVVNTANPVNNLTAEELADLLLKKRSTWQDGTPVEPVDLGPSSAVRESLSGEVLGRPVAAVKSYWQTQAFSGSLTPPPELDSEAQVVAFVRDHRGGLGYVAAGTPLTGVKSVPLLVPPQRLSVVQPQYPTAAASARISGNVLLRLTIGRSGEVIDVKVLQGLPMGVTEEAVRAAKQWKYRPGTYNGQPVETPVEVTLHFGR